MQNSNYYCNSTGLVCFGRGTCLGSGTEAARCECQNFYEPSTECSKTYWNTWGSSMMAISSVFIVIYSLIALVAAAELVPDFIRIRPKRVFTSPFTFAKVLVILVCFAGLSEKSFNVLNGLHGKDEVQGQLIINIEAVLMTVFLGIFVTMVLFSWIEIIERARTLDEAIWLRNLRIVTIVFMVIVVLQNIFIQVYLNISKYDATFALLKNIQIYVTVLYILYLLAASITCVIRGRHWWSSDGSDIIKHARNKTKWFIGTVCAVGGIILVGILETSLGASSSALIVTNTFWNIEYVAICVFGLIFLQRNIHRRNKWFPERSFASMSSGGSIDSMRTTKKRSNSTTSTSSSTRTPNETVVTASVDRDDRLPSNMAVSSSTSTAST